MSKAEELLNVANGTNFAEDYVKAGNHFIIEDEYSLAAVSFQRAGEIYMVNNKYVAAGTFVKAADNHVKVKKYEQAQELLNVAINIYLEEGKFASAAKQLQNLGDIYIVRINKLP
jgi:tetratricopeptide (TPR) repeat protein